MQLTIIEARNLFDSNSYLLAGDGGFVLIDTGVARRRKAVDDALVSVGCRPGDLRLIILTHAHTDHAGNCAHLRESYRAPIGMHEGDAAKAERGDMFWRPQGLTPSMKVAKAMTALAGIASFDPFAPDVLLADGQGLAEYGLAATVHHLPGHSPGSICVLTQEGDFFCGDLFTSTRGPQRNSIMDVAADYEASVTRLGDLPIRMVYPGHGRPFRPDELAE